MDTKLQALRAFLHAHPRPLLLAVACCLLLALLAYETTAGDTPALRRAAAVPQPSASQPSAPQQAPAPVKKILGAEAARAGTPLTNPFSLQHETRQARSQPDAAHARPAAAAPPATAAGPPPRSAAATSPTPPAPAPVPLLLKGIARSADTAAASISDGAQTHLLFVGDTVGGYTVSAIGERSVTLTGTAATLTLRLPDD
ncbi:hypothetical protein [uncultured Selenomonas sp.]|uniref:hypothetical protein n=1 Tax=uncultured Selenomonas sp. TaxID=159275 RepID=UPI00258B6E0C|nr:hypothetical protein [uncultured Selenomonas sp.]